MKIIYYILFFFYWTSLFAQSIPYQQYTVDDGLPSNLLYGVTQDAEGYIWVYTDKGVAKFNGSNFKVFTVHDGLPNNDIWGITKDRKGRLWIHCLSKALAYIEKDTIHTIFECGKEKKKGLYPITARITEEGILFLNHTSKEYLYVTDSVSVLSYLDAPKPGQVELMTSIAIAVCLSDHLHPKWMQYISEIPPGSLKKYKRTDPREVYYFKNHLIYKTIDGIFFFSLKDYTTRIIPFDTKYGGSPSFLNFKEVDETLQISSNLRLQVFDAALELIDEFDFSTLDNNKRAIRGSLLDREGNIWIATVEDGLLLITANQRSARIIHTANVHAVTATKGEVYIGTADGDLYKQNKEFKTQLLRKGKENNVSIAKSILSKEKQGTILFAVGQEGIFHYDLKKDSVFTANHFFDKKKPFFFQDLGQTTVDTLSSKKAFNRLKRIFHIFKDVAWQPLTNTRYITTIRDTWKYEEEENWTKLTRIIKKRATDLALGKEEKVWIGHVDGLSSYSDGIYQEVGNRLGLLGAKVNTLTADSLGNVWVGTDGFGVYAYNGETVFEVAETKKDIVKHIYLDEDGYLWVSTNQGVKQLYIEFGNQEQTRLIRHFQTKDGLPTNAANCVYIDSVHIYVGTGKGLIRIQKETSSFNNKELPLYMEEIKINGKLVSPKPLYTLTHKERELEMSFIALSYQSLGAIKYYYQLENTDRVEQVSTDGKIRYPALEKGRHLFKVYAEDLGGNKSDPITFELHVLPPWWQTMWFIGLLFLLAMLGVYSIYYYRIQYITNREAERSRIQQEIAAYELQALQAQMNPHFIFNSLTTIQYFINKNDKKSANKYLTTFGDLTRAFLEASQSRSISLEQELVLLKMYMDLEQMRFEEKFETKIIVDELIDIYTTEIPSMLLQPFVENSINHGFFHKDGKGKLELLFSANEDGGLTCTIKDDGIGREQARIIKENSIRKHKSRGTQIVEKRLAVLSKMEGHGITVEIRDVHDTAQQIAGTCVKIRIPEIK